MQAAKPDVVLIWTVQAPASKVVSALSKVGSTTPVFSSNAQISPQFYQLAGSLANGIVSTGLKAQFDSGKATTAFTKKYTSAFELFPDSAAAKGDKAALKGEAQPSNEQIAFASLMRGVHW